MKCSECQENLSAMVDGELASTEIPGTLTHAGSCEECQRFMMNVLDERSQLRAVAPRQVLPGLAAPPAWTTHGGLRRTSRSFLEDFVAGFRQRLTLSAPVGAGILLFGMLLSAALVYWWVAGKGHVVPPEPTVVYMMELPPLEVHAMRVN